MINFCGQDIQIGDYVGLGVRSGNGTEHRVGRVLRLLNEPRAAWEEPEWRAECVWYDRSPERKADAYTFVSKQRAHGLFKLDPDTLGREQRKCLDIGYNRIKGRRF